jgi:cell division protein FtsA
MNKSFDVYFDLCKPKIRAVVLDSNDKKKIYCEKNLIFKTEDLEKEIKEVISHIESDIEDYVDELTILVDSPNVMSVSLSLLKKLDGSKLRKEDIQFLIQSGKQQILSNYLNLNILHIIINNYKIDNRDYDFLPNDINCKLISVDIIFICLPKNEIINLKKLFSRLDVSINQIYCTSYIKSLSYKKRLMSVKNITFIDIGFRKTSIINYKKDKIISFNFVPIGENHITKDLSEVLNIDFLEAEKIKIKFYKDYASSNENFSPDLIQNIISARVEEILRLSLKYSTSYQNPKENIFFKKILIGESAKILNNLFKEKIALMYEIDLLEENNIEIFQSAQALKEGSNKQEVVIIPKKQDKIGLFERLFHIFK